MLHYIPQNVSSSTLLILGGQIVLLQPLVSLLSVNSRTVCRLRADWVRSQPAYWTAVYREWRYQRPNLSSWRWARYCSKHVEDYNV